MNLLDLQNIPVKEKPYSFGIKDSRAKGLSVRVKANGDKEYVYRYRFADKQPTINLGDVFASNYEDIIEKVIGFNNVLKQGFDPAQDNRHQLNPYYEYVDQPFRVIADLWIKHQIQHKKPDKRTLYNYNYVVGMLNKYIGDILINSLRSVSMLNVCQTIQRDYSPHYGILARRYASMIFRFGITFELCKSDPTVTLAEQLTTPATVHHPAITEEEDFKKLIYNMHHFERCHKIVWHAMNIMPHVFVRSSDLLHWKWEDIDFKAKQWVFEPSKKGRIKMVKSLIVPLSDPVLERLDAVREYTGQSSGLVFPSPKTMSLARSDFKPLGSTTLLKTFYRMGYKGEQCVHGFRACAKTLLMQKEEFRYEEIPTELQLGHHMVNNYGQAYNRMHDIEVRTKMMSDWSSYLQSLILPLDNEKITND